MLSKINAMIQSKPLSNQLIQYKHIDILNILDTLCYSHQKMIETSKFYPLNPCAYEIWHNHNINSHQAVNRRKKDRVIYLGWTENYLSKFVNPNLIIQMMFLI